LDIKKFLQDPSSGLEVSFGFTRLGIIFYIIDNVIADLLLIYRLYVIWNRRKRVVVVPLVILITGCVVLPTVQTVFCGYVYATLGLNTLVSALMVGRIWWISRAAGKALGSKFSKRRNLAVAVIVESGVIYVIASVVYIVHQPIGLALIQIVGIVPTLLIVQVGLGRETQSVETTIAGGYINSERGLVRRKIEVSDLESPGITTTIPPPYFKQEQEPHHLIIHTCPCAFIPGDILHEPLCVGHNTDPSSRHVLG